MCIRDRLNVAFDAQEASPPPSYGCCRPITCTLETALIQRKQRDRGMPWNQARALALQIGNSGDLFASQHPRVEEDATKTKNTVYDGCSVPY